MLNNTAFFLKLGAMRLVWYLSPLFFFFPFRLSSVFPIFWAWNWSGHWGLVLIHFHLPVLDRQDAQNLNYTQSRFLGVLCCHNSSLLCYCFNFFSGPLTWVPTSSFFAVFPSLYSASVWASLSLMHSSIFLCNYYAFYLPFLSTTTLLLPLVDPPLSVCIVHWVVFVGAIRYYQLVPGFFCCSSVGVLASLR